MVHPRSHSIDFKREMAPGVFAGDETLHTPTKRRDLSRNRTRLRVARFEAETGDDNRSAAARSPPQPLPGQTGPSLRPADRNRICGSLSVRNLALLPARAGNGSFRKRLPAPTSAVLRRSATLYFEECHCGQAMSPPFDRLLAKIKACSACAPHLPLGPRPLFLGRPSARLLVISQAPGVRAHETSLSFNDRSGDRLRAWLGIGREDFYDESRVAILPMGFCYPGRDAKGGDLPPRPECAPLWHPPVRVLLPNIALTLLVGGYAVRYYWRQKKAQPLSETLSHWREVPSDLFLLPHPSWRTTQWLARNPWFEREALPELRERVGHALNGSARSEPSPRR